MDLHLIKIEAGWTPITDLKSKLEVENGTFNHLLSNETLRAHC